MRSSHPGNFQNFVKQSEWKRKLAEEKIDTELLAAQVEFNRSEGGIEDFLNFRSEAQFMRKFLAMTVPEAEAAPVRAVLEEHVGRLADLPRLERRRDAILQLKERFAPFVEIAGKAQAATEDVSRRVGHATGLKAALNERGAQASQRAEALSEKASAHETAANQADAGYRRARVEFASAMVEMARGRHEAAKALTTTREVELGQAKSRRDRLQGAVLMREILDDRARIESLREAIDAEHADLQPRRDALRSMGADLEATLNRRATAMRERQISLTTDAAESEVAAREAEEERVANDESAQAERRKITGIDVNLGHAQDFRARLEGEEVLGSGESAEAASHRHAEAARAVGDEARKLRRLADEKDEATRAHRDCQGDLKAERSGTASEIGSLQETIREGDEKRRSLALESTILELTGESDVNPESDAVDRMLADARNKSAATLRDSERRQELLEADRESLEATGLASIDTDVRTVVERLRFSGIPDAQPYAVYLSEIVRSAEDVRRFAVLDPSRFAGVAVPNLNALDEARRVLQSPPPLSRPVTVAIADDVPGETPADRFALAVDEPAAYDRGAARKLQRRIEDDRVPERGQDIAAEMVERMTAALGRGTLDIRLLKPKGEGDTEHMPIERVTVSGGELLTAAMMIYLVIARLRADAMHGGTREAGVLILDHPLGKANKALLLKTQTGLADAMGIQLFYATGVQDTSALAAFENIVRLRRNRQSRATRRIHVEIEKMHAHIDRITDGEASAAATAELAAN